MNDETSFNPFSLSGRRILVTGASSGLGLAIVKHVLLRHRARLEISSVPGHGSTFTCHFAPAQVVRSQKNELSV